MPKRVLMFAADPEGREPLGISMRTLATGVVLALSVIIKSSPLATPLSILICAPAAKGMGAGAAATVFLAAGFLAAVVASVFFAGALAAILAEVHNTFGERHCYLLSQARFGVEQRADKVFHVSPFCSVEGQYRFRFMRTQERTVARIDHDDALGALIQTSVSGHLVALSTRTQWQALLRYPLMTVMVVVRIHWQAFKLWRKKVTFFSKPTPPQDFVTR